MTGPPMQIPQMSEQEKKADPNLSLQSGVNPTLGISTPPQPGQVTDPALIAQQQAQQAAAEAIRKEAETVRRASEQDRKIAELTNTVQALVTEKNKPPPQTPDEAAKEFYKDPKKVIQDVMRETVAPLNEFKSTYEAESAYTQLKRQYKADARYVAYFKRPGFETMIDTVVREAGKTGVPVNAQFVESAITHTIGQVATGVIQFPDPIAEAQPPKFDAQTGAPIAQPLAAEPNPVNQMIPPYLAPSSPPSPGPVQQKTQRRELTENEDRIRRENKQSLEEWWAWQDMPSTEVVDSKVGIPEPAEKK